MNNIGIIIVLLVLLAGGYYFFAGDNNDSNTNTTEVASQDDPALNIDGNESNSVDVSDSEGSDNSEVAPGDDPALNLDGGSAPAAEEPVSRARGSFEAYSPSKVENADGKVVLGFFADWCPSCQALKGDLSASASDIPGNLTIFDIDYDNSADLKKKYGVTTQHTLVEVDSSGNLVQKWSGGNTLASVVAKVN